MKRASLIRPKSSLYVLDTSALIAYLCEEAGADQVQAIRSHCSIPFIALTELYYVTWRKQNQVIADETIQYVSSWHMPVLFPDQRVSLSAGYIKAQYQLGIADSYVAAMTLEHRATLVTKDSDFQSLKLDIKLLFLS